MRVRVQLDSGSGETYKRAGPVFRGRTGRLAREAGRAGPPEKPGGQAPEGGTRRKSLEQNETQRPQGSHLRHSSLGCGGRTPRKAEQAVSLSRTCVSFSAISAVSGLEGFLSGGRTERTGLMKRTALLSMPFAALLVLCAAPAAPGMYHPTLGRFVQRDPDEDAISGDLYEYARSSPALYVDSHGAKPYEPQLVPASAVAAREAREKAAGRATQAAGPGRGFTRDPTPQAGTMKRLDGRPGRDVMQDLKNALEELCPCLAYNISPDGNRLDIGTNSDYGDPPSEKFCCCYYKNIAGCNLVLMFRDRDLTPAAKDAPVQPGASVSQGVEGVGDSTRGGRNTTLHELGHMALGGGQNGAHEASNAFATIVGTMTNPPTSRALHPIKGTQYGQTYAADIRKAIDAFGRNRYPDCEGKVGKAPQSSQNGPHG